MTSISNMGGFIIGPVHTAQTTSVIPNGYGGNAPLPVIEIEGGRIVAFVVPTDALKAMSENPYILQLLLADDGTVSLSAMPVVVRPEN